MAGNLEIGDLSLAERKNLIFGGGCTILIVGSGLMSDPSEFLSDIPLLLSILLPLGILPAVGGWLLFRRGLKIDREKRNALGKREQV